MMNETGEIAREYIEAGISVIPVRCDGSKAPAVRSWTPYRERFATDGELDQWFGNSAIGIVCGIQSGGLEVIDFDDPDCFEPWKERLNPTLAASLPVVETGSLGFHVWYRCAEVSGNTKLALWGDGRSKSTRIETRGEGGYVVAPGSPLAVHSSGNPYVQLAGPVLPMVPTITSELRRQLWEAARSFDEARGHHPDVERELKRRTAERAAEASVSRPDGDLTPWDDFDARGNLADVLQQAGWPSLGGGCFSRPRQDGQWHTSARIVTSEKTGHRVLSVFSTNVPDGLRPQHGKPCTSYGAFHVYKTLIHGGDGKAAARNLANLGYGMRQSNG